MYLSRQMSDIKYLDVVKLCGLQSSSLHERYCEQGKLNIYLIFHYDHNPQFYYHLWQTIKNHSSIVFTRLVMAALRRVIDLSEVYDPPHNRLHGAHESSTVLCNIQYCNCIFAGNNDVIVWRLQYGHDNFGG